jgi:carbon-monoxide dehydrogenase large subunit
VLSGYDDLVIEQQARRAAGTQRQLGVGLSLYVEVGAGHESQREDYASVEVGADGRVTVLAGTAAHGQGHATTYAQIVSAVLGTEPGDVGLIDGDTGRVPRGVGTQGSRSTQIGGSAVHRAATAVLDKATQLAAHLLEAPPEDIVVLPGGRGLSVAGVPTSGLSWAELAGAASDPVRRPAGMAPGLVAGPGFAQQSGTAPFGCHIAVVEVDTETGEVELVRMFSVDDCGTRISPLLVDGQVHGGVASGVGQALYEEIRFDDAGNPLTTTFAEYALPSAAEFPSFVNGHTVTPSPLNPLGAKGVGEGGTTGSIPAVQNAVIDALAHLGVRHIDLPLTPERVWTALRDAVSVD